MKKFLWAVGLFIALTPACTVLCMWSGMPQWGAAVCGCVVWFACDIAAEKIVSR